MAISDKQDHYYFYYSQFCELASSGGGRRGGAHAVEFQFSDYNKILFVLSLEAFPSLSRVPGIRHAAKQRGSCSHIYFAAK